MKSGDEVTILYRDSIDSIHVVDFVSGNAATAGPYSLALDEYQRASNPRSKGTYRWRLTTDEDRDYVNSEADRRAAEVKARQDFNAREDVKLAKRIASLCNGDVDDRITCGLLDLGVEKLRRIVAIIDSREDS